MQQRLTKHDPDKVRAAFMLCKGLSQTSLLSYNLNSGHATTAGITGLEGLGI